MTAGAAGRGRDTEEAEQPPQPLALAPAGAPLTLAPNVVNAAERRAASAVVTAASAAERSSSERACTAAKRGPVTSLAALAAKRLSRLPASVQAAGAR